MACGLNSRRHQDSLSGPLCSYTTLWLTLHLILSPLSLSLLSVYICVISLSLQLKANSSRYLSFSLPHLSLSSSLFLLQCCLSLVVYVSFSLSIVCPPILTLLTMAHNLSVPLTLSLSFSTHVLSLSLTFLISRLLSHSVSLC